MEPLDPKAELMRLAHLNALAYSAWNDDATAESKADYVHAETAMESAITLALAAERRRALEEAFSAVTKWIKPGELQGNGCDDTAKRNGMIMAANLLGKLIDVKEVWT